MSDVLARFLGQLVVVSQVSVGCLVEWLESLGEAPEGKLHPVQVVLGSFLGLLFHRLEHRRSVGERQLWAEHLDDARREGFPTVDVKFSWGLLLDNLEPVVDWRRGDEGEDCRTGLDLV